jgi:integrase
MEPTGMSRVRLTETKIKSLKNPGVYRDDMVHGLFVDVSDTSARYKLQSTTKDRRTLRKTLGRTTDYTLDQARRWAQDVLGANRRGEVIREADRNVPTLQEALDAYLSIRERKGQDDVWSANIKHQFNRHLSDWLKKPVDQITPDMVEKRHAKIGNGYTVKQPRKDGEGDETVEVGGHVAANHAIKSLRAVLNKVRVLKDSNPVQDIEWFVPAKKVDEHGLPVQRAVMPDDLPAWWRQVETLENPLRRCFHRLMLLSGIRSGHLKEARRAWINLDARYIHFPQLKAGRPFKLPLSTPMVALVKEALSYGDERSPWLFPAESGAGHLVEPRDKSLLKKGIKQGHDLRRTYVSLAAKTPIPQHHREFLVDHTVKGMHGLYVDPDAMFPELLAAQEQISALILNAAGAAFTEN